MSDPQGDAQPKDKENQRVPLEQIEEAKLRAKYPQLGPKTGGSAFLMKRLHKGQQKYFDSGDYNMYKANQKNKAVAAAAAAAANSEPACDAGPEKEPVTGDHIPTPQDLPQRKPSLVASKLLG
ncbi:cAMP-regulated phosphoprotein 19-like [Lethenteron reissneri]|uniref:cAMP-regulated phosphoprotein 19-like n=1 Tax=Lethenteron reissneri TaxID=7753 RepID=UPI002AB7E7CF|nr:cAMP-regulated phosphoprotein 19-like [Lethenteron reissneri]